MKSGKSLLVIGGRTSSLALAVALLGGCMCTPTVRQPPEVIDTGCYTYEPIRPTLQDIKVISPQLATAILEHNRKYKRWCLEKQQGAP